MSNMRLRGSYIIIYDPLNETAGTPANPTRTSSDTSTHANTRRASEKCADVWDRIAIYEPIWYHNSDLVLPEFSLLCNNGNADMQERFFIYIYIYIYIYTFVLVLSGVQM